MFDDLTAEQRQALIYIVEAWIYDGSQTPPYEAAYYDIFEGLGLAYREWLHYDIRRPVDAEVAPVVASPAPEAENQPD